MRRTLLAATVVAAIFGAHAWASAQAVVGIGEQSAGTTVHLQRGDLLAVSLSANGTTGYHWRLAAVDRTVLLPDAATYVTSLHPTGLVGSGGVALMTFKAVARGHTALRLVYVGPGRSPAIGKRFAVTVVVR
jgi:predicted secreted protein